MRIQLPAEIEETTVPTRTPAIPRFTQTPQPTPTSTPPGMALLDIAPNQFGVNSGKSPDGQWLWAIESGSTADETGDFSYHKTRFARVDGSVYWVVRPEQHQLGRLPTGEISYRPVFWMPNDPFVYLTADPCCQAHTGLHFMTGYNLMRLNLNTGAVAIQVAGLAMHDFAFSPRGQYLADIAEADQVLWLRRLPEGEIHQIPLAKGFNLNGGTVFSPDDKLAVVQSCVRRQPNITGCERTALLLINVETARFSELVPDLEAALGSLVPGKFASPRLSWVDTAHLHVDFSAETKIPWSWRIDVKTGHINRVTQ